MGYYRDLRDFLGDLEKRGMVFRWPWPVNKDTELLPLHLLQFRGLPEEKRKVFLFENVTDAHGRSYKAKVATGIYGLSSQVFALGMNCKEPGELSNRWHQGVTRRIEPRVVKAGSVQEVVRTAGEIESGGLSELPAPVEQPGFSGTIRVTGPFITCDPETGIRNVGMYSGHFRAKNRMMAGIGAAHHAMLYHWRTAKKRGEPLPVAVVIGATPNITAVASAGTPYGVDELAIAGGIAEEPVEVVQCKTVDLEVPASAEIVIEGLLSTEVLEPYTAYGEYPGYMMAERRSNAIVEVTCITHRKDPIFVPILVGLPPSDSNNIGNFCHDILLHNFLRYDCNLPTVLEVASDEMGGANYCVIRIRKTHPSQPKQVLHAAAGREPGGKVFIVVDEDIHPKEPEMVNWALSFSMQPHQDVEIITGRVPGLDPSGAPPEVTGNLRHFPPPIGTSAILIDATRKWAYPPVGLPQKQYMQRALDLWREANLPSLQLKEPWHGYELGLWTEDERENANLIARGEYLKLGEKMRERQSRVE
jgi:4-hydroxy-3-polyprenylbenzoate decarboxylase